MPAALRAGEIAIVIPDDLSATRLDLLPGDSLIFSKSGSVAGFIRPAHDRAARLKSALALEESKPWYRPLEDEVGLRDRCFLPTEFAPESVAWTPALLERPPARPRPFPAALEWDDERAVGGVVRCIMVRAGREIDDARAVAMVIEMRQRAGMAFQSRLLQDHPDQRIIAYIDVPQCLRRDSLNWVWKIYYTDGWKRPRRGDFYKWRPEESTPA